MPFASLIKFFLSLNSISDLLMNLANSADGPLCKASLGQQVNIFKLHEIATCYSNFEKSLIFRHAVPDSGYIGRV